MNTIGGPLLEDRFKSMVEDEIKEYDLKLYQKYLTIHNTSNNSLHGIIELSYIKCIWIDEEKKRKIKDLKGIIFLKCGNEFEVYSNHITNNNWTELLRKMVLINDLHQEYHVKREIGKGSFARVLSFYLFIIT